MTENKMVLPGDQVSTSEELLPGDGTFEENGIIRASRAGTYYVDEKHHKATVKPSTSIPVELKRGDIVLASVGSVRSSMIIANVLHVTGKNRDVSGDTNGTLRVSEIADGYIKDPSMEYAPGDIIRAKVIQVQPNIQLATKGRDLGVIRALCSKCGQHLERKENGLECSNCGWKERRRTADDYGNYNLKEL